MSEAAPAGTPSRYRVGVIMVLMAGVCLSLSGIIVRNLETTDGWQIIFYRSVFFLVTVFTWIAVRYRGRILPPFAAIGRNGLIIAVCLGMGSICYLFGVLFTTVANVVFIISAAPFFTALAGWMLLGERISLTTWTAMSAALLGVGLMVLDGLATGRLLGNLFAFGVVVSYVSMLIALRRSVHLDMVPAIFLAGVVSAAISAVFLESFAISGEDLPLLALLGSVQFAGGFILITLGSRYVPAAQVALLSLTETVLAPIWVWVGVHEVPSYLTLGGGLVVLVAVLYQSVEGVRAERAPA